MILQSIVIKNHSNIITYVIVNILRFHVVFLNIQWTLPGRSCNAHWMFKKKIIKKFNEHEKDECSINVHWTFNEHYQERSLNVDWTFIFFMLIDLFFYLFIFFFLTFNKHCRSVLVMFIECLKIPHEIGVCWL